MRKLAVVTNLPTPYRVPLFNLLAPRLRTIGWDLEVVFGSRTNQRRKWVLADDALRFPHRFLEARNVRLARERIVNSYGGLRGALREISPDVVVCTGFSRGTMTAARFGAPMVIWSGATAGSEKGLLRSIQRRWLVRRAERFLAYGSAARDYLVGLGADRARVHLAWNTVDTQRFLGLHPSAPDQSFRLLFVGYLEKRKRLDLLLRALREACARGANLALDIVGDGSERAALERQADGLPVRFLGYRKYDELGPLYESADAFMFPTGFDVWGLVLIESMAAGLASVASVRAGATRDLVADGETGYAVDFEDTGTVADRLVALSAMPDRARAMGRAARTRIEGGFTLDHSADGWIEMVQSLETESSQAPNRRESKMSSMLSS